MLNSDFYIGDSVISMNLIPLHVCHFLCWLVTICRRKISCVDFHSKIVIFISCHCTSINFKSIIPVYLVTSVLLTSQVQSLTLWLKLKMFFKTTKVVMFLICANFDGSNCVLTILHSTFSSCTRIYEERQTCAIIQTFTSFLRIRSAKSFDRDPWSFPVSYPDVPSTGSHAGPATHSLLLRATSFPTFRFNALPKWKPTCTGLWDLFRFSDRLVSCLFDRGVCQTCTFTNLFRVRFANFTASLSVCIK